ncbi:MAG: methionyl-tRNA formyltransferase [Deltaproteobacteria bacterium]|nr:MAG: methionyl-tRNA formyltransferase [Deltaproteobacteria bacterium]
MRSTISTGFSSSIDSVRSSGPITAASSGRSRREVPSVKPLRIGFFGTPDFAVPSLEALLSTPHEVVVVATQPDRGRGRGRSVVPSPVKRVAGRHGIPILQPRRAREPGFHEALSAQGLDLIVVVAYGLILPREILDLPPLGCINVHASLLPKYRGAAPIQWAIARGERVTGVTTMLMDAGMDTGDILLQAEEPILPRDTAATLHDRLARRGAELLLETISGCQAGTITPRKQDEAQATYAPRLEKEDGAIDWTQSAEAIDRRVRAFFPWPGTHTFWQGIRIKLIEVTPLPHERPAAPAGTVVQVERSGIRVATGEGSLLLTTLQREGRSPLPIDRFLSGTPIRVGDRFISSPPGKERSSP